MYMYKHSKKVEDGTCSREKIASGYSCIYVTLEDTRREVTLYKRVNELDHYALKL